MAVVKRRKRSLILVQLDFSVRREPNIRHTAPPSGIASVASVAVISGISGLFPLIRDVTDVLLLSLLSLCALPRVLCLIPRK